MSRKKSIKVINNHYRIFKEDPVKGVSIDFNEDDIYNWNFILEGPEDTPWEGGMFKGKIQFPENYPFKPPKVQFVTPIYHPNIYEDGKVCISILHPPGDDEFGYESAAERWRPVHTVNSILMSIITLFADPNDESPANVDAAKDWRNNDETFRSKVNKCVRDSVEAMDKGENKDENDVKQQD